ncbi:MAG: hypothetical protein V4543_03220 [Bacteroidota bacterium]
MYSQKSLADSLTNALTVADSAQIYIDFIESAYREDPDNGFRIGQLVIAWAKMHRDEETRIQALLLSAHIYFCKGKSDSLQQYLYIVEQQAGTAAYKALSPLTDMGWYNFYVLNRNWKEGLKYLKKGIATLHTMPDSERKNEMLVKLLCKYATYYDVYEDEHKHRLFPSIHDSIFKYNRMVNAVLLKVKNRTKLLPHYYVQQARTNLYRYAKSPEKSLDYLNEIIPVFKSKNNFINLEQCYEDMALIYEQQDYDIRKGILYLDSAIYYASILNTYYHKWNYYQDKARFLKEAGQYKLSFDWYDSLILVSRLMFNNEISERLAVAEKKFESVALRAKNAEAEAEIARSGRFIYGIILCFVTLSGAAGFAFYRHNNRQQAQAAQAKRRTELADQRRIITEQLNRQISAERTEVNALLEEMLVRDKQNIPLNGLRNAVQSYLTGNTSRDQRRQKFTELYPDFFVNLLMRHPGLTPSEQDIAMFVAEGTSNTDMAEIFSWVNTDSAANRKSKLKVKLGFSSLPDLERYLSALK